MTKSTEIYHRPVPPKSPDHLRPRPQSSSASIISFAPTTKQQLIQITTSTIDSSTYILSFHQHHQLDQNQVVPVAAQPVNIPLAWSLKKVVRVSNTLETVVDNCSKGITAKTKRQAKRGAIHFVRGGPKEKVKPKTESLYWDS